MNRPAPGQGGAADRAVRVRFADRYRAVGRAAGLIALPPAQQESQQKADEDQGQDTEQLRNGNRIHEVILAMLPET